MAPLDLFADPIRAALGVSAAASIALVRVGAAGVAVRLFGRPDDPTAVWEPFLPPPDAAP